MADQSNDDVEKLHALILEMEKTIFRLSPGLDTSPYTLRLLKIKDDVHKLQELAIVMGKLIYPIIPGTFMKGVVNSVLDSLSVDDALHALKFFNNKKRLILAAQQKAETKLV